MTLNLFLVFGLVFFLFSLVSRRIQGTIFTYPILFTAAGYAMHSLLQGEAAMSFGEGGFHIVAEITLILVLAVDAAQVPIEDIRKRRGTAARLLIVALPLIIISGTLVGLALFPDKPWYLMALVAAILAPTDSALAAPVLENPNVPPRVKQAALIESGLNDGIALPAVLFFACFLNMMHQTGEENWILFLALQLTLGPIAGIAIGWLGGKVIALAATRGWILDTFQGISALALPIIAYAAAETVHGNGFIAAFACGAVYGSFRDHHSKFMHEFTETESQFLTQMTFLLFGAFILPEALGHTSVAMWLYALLALTVIRIAPVMLSLTGSPLLMRERIFIGWFGPRGLASVLFAILILEELNVAQAEFVQSIVAVTVVCSILLHGVTAAPATNRLAKAAQEGKSI